MNTKETRPPVIAVLGHVDHGKTTLLDTIRKTHVAKGEFGGITQHIGAYEIVTAEGKKITFIDTPGHEAFKNLRKRGVAMADIALLVVAADDSVQPQTIESIKVIKESNIPYIVVVNKIDVEGVNVERVLKHLNKNEVYLEGHGGDVPFVEISAKNATNIDALLELITLLSEVSNFTYSKTAPVLGGVIEVKKDRRGTVLTLILKDGALNVGDTVYVDEEEIKIKAMFNDLGVSVVEVFPSTPVEMLGAKLMAKPGAVLSTVSHLQKEVVAAEKKSTGTVSQADFFGNNDQKFNFIIKSDVSGTEEVIKERFSQFKEIDIIKSEVGEPNEADVDLAKTTGANILVFNVKVRNGVAKKAEVEGVNIFEYTLIYELLEQAEDLIYSLRSQREKEAKKIGEAKILAKFNKENQQIAGMRIISGRIQLNDKAELTRGKKILGETTIRSLYQKSNSVSNVKKNEECGAIFDPKLDFQPGDIVKLYLR